jgi:hypothetical protein
MNRVSAKAAITAVAVLLHLWVTASVLRQPLNVGTHPDARRFVTWQLYFDSTHYNGPGIDFFAVYHAGVNDRTAVSPYSMYERFGGVTPYFFEFRYLPIVGSTLGRTVILMTPLMAYRAWVVTTELMFWFVALILLRGLWRGPAGFVGWLALVVSTPFFLELHMGQFTFMTTALLGMALWLRRRGSTPQASRVLRVAAGAVAAMAVLLKLFPAVALIAWVRRRSMWLSLAAGAAFVVCCAGSPFLIRPQLWREFLSANTVVPPNPGNVGALYVLHLLAEHLGYAPTREGWVHVVQVALALFVGSAALVVVLSRRRALYAETGVLLLAQFLASFQVWEHYMSAAIVAGALLLLDIETRSDASAPTARGPERLDRICAWVAAVSLVLLALPTPFALFGEDLKSWTFLERMAVQVAKPGPTLVLYVTGLLWLSREGFAWPGSARRNSPADDPGVV